MWTNLGSPSLLRCSRLLGGLGLRSHGCCGSRRSRISSGGSSFNIRFSFLLGGLDLGRLGLVEHVNYVRKHEAGQRGSMTVPATPAMSIPTLLIAAAAFFLITPAFGFFATFGFLVSGFFASFTGPEAPL